MKMNQFWESFLSYKFLWILTKLLTHRSEPSLQSNIDIVLSVVLFNYSRNKWGKTWALFLKNHIVCPTAAVTLTFVNGPANLQSPPKPIPETQDNVVSYTATYTLTLTFIYIELLPSFFCSCQDCPHHPANAVQTVFLYCCPGCPSCKTHPNSIGY